MPELVLYGIRLMANPFLGTFIDIEVDQSGYRSELTPNSSRDFLHILTNESLTVDGWRPKQPNAKKGDQCLCSYLGLAPNASW